MGLIQDLRKAVGLDTNAIQENSWEQRLAQAAYTSPSGLRITFDYENIQKTTTKKTTAFDFPDADGVLVQDHGVGRRRFPHRIFFWGPNHDKQAAVFEAALEERGAGKLESPFYGEHLVVPFGDFTRRDDLKRAANQTVFEVTFFQTIGETYPTSEGDAASAIATSLELYGNSSDADFATRISLSSVAEERGIIATIEALTGRVEDGLKKVAAVQDAVNDNFQDLVDTVNNSIDVLIGTPLQLARTTRNMIQAPSRALAGVQARLDGYGNLASDIFSSTDAVSDPGGPGGLGPRFDLNPGSGNDLQSPNKFHTRDLFAGNFVAGSVQSTLFTANIKGGASSLGSVQTVQTNATAGGVSGESEIKTAPQAIAAAEELLAQFEAWRTWRDLNFQSIAGDDRAYINTLNNTDTGGAYGALQRAVAFAAGALIELSFSLLRERSIVLDKARALPELVYELYGDDIDAKLDFFIDSNNLSLEEILEIPKGRKVVWYG